MAKKVILVRIVIFALMVYQEKKGSLEKMDALVTTELMDSPDGLDQEATRVSQAMMDHED